MNHDTFMLLEGSLLTFLFLLFIILGLGRYFWNRLIKFRKILLERKDERKTYSLEVEVDWLTPSSWLQQLWKDQK